MKDTYKVEWFGSTIEHIVNCQINHYLINKGEISSKSDLCFEEYDSSSILMDRNIIIRKREYIGVYNNLDIIYETYAHQNGNDDYIDIPTYDDKPDYKESLIFYRYDKNKPQLKIRSPPLIHLYHKHIPRHDKAKQNLLQINLINPSSEFQKLYDECFVEVFGLTSDKRSRKLVSLYSFSTLIKKIEMLINKSLPLYYKQNTMI